MPYSDHRNRKTDSLENVLRTTHDLDDEEQLGIYKELMWGYLNTDGTRAAGYARKALALSYRGQWLNSRADALRILGLTAYGAGDYDTALRHYKQALAVTDSMRNIKRYKESDIDDNLSSLYGSIANLYNMQDRLHLAIAYYQKALPIFEKYGWVESTAILYHNIGELYMSMGNNKEAVRNYQSAVEAAQRSADSLLIAMSHKGLAKIYISQSNWDKADKATQECMAYYRHHINEERGDYLTVLVCMGRLALKGYNDVQQAENHAREAIRLADGETMPDILADVYNFCCEVAMERGQWHEALRYAQQAIDTDTAETYEDLGTYVYLTQIYAELGDKEKVKDYVARIYNGMEHMATDHYQSGLSQMEVLYETEKKQNAIQQLQTERRLFLVGGGLLILLLVMGVLLFFLLWRSVRLGRKNALIMAKLDGELAERMRIARDLHDRLGGTLTALRLRLSDTDNAKPYAQSPSALALTDTAIREMRNVAHHLLPDSLRHYGLRTALADYCQTMPHVSFAYTGADRRILHEEVIYCIVYELVNNAVKNSEARHISVQIVAGDDYTAINVSDDGRGFVCCDSVATHTTPSTSGLNNIRERVKAIGGTIDIYSEAGKGTEVNIEIPNHETHPNP